MNIDRAFSTFVRRLFSPLAKMPGGSPFPSSESLLRSLEQYVPQSRRDPAASVHLSPKLSNLFATGAVEMWQRAVHSYLISASLTEVSPIWASVSGYYSSHYSVRAFAHLMGRFLLFNRKRIAKLTIMADKKILCEFERRDGDSREHKYYWKVVKESVVCVDDPLFTKNPPNTEPSDVAHRDLANYADHIGRFPRFNPLDEKRLRARTTQIAEIGFVDPPIPRFGSFPDLERVQVIAYHRLIAFRRALDQVLGSENRYWNGQRNPNWAGILSFQLVDQGGLREGAVA